MYCFTSMFRRNMIRQTHLELGPREIQFVPGRGFCINEYITAQLSAPEVVNTRDRRDGALVLYAKERQPRILSDFITEPGSPLS